MSEARYYVTKEPSTDLTLLNGIIAGLEQWLIEAQTGAGTYNKVLRIAGVSVAGQIVEDVLDITVNSSNNTATIAGAVVDLTVTNAGELVVGQILEKGALALGLGLTGGWLAITATVGVDVLYSVFLEDSADDIIDELAGTIDVDLQLKESIFAEELIGGAYYKDGINTPTDLREAIKGLLSKSGVNGFPEINADDMYIDIEGGTADGDRYFLYDGKLVEDLANFFHGGNIEEFLSINSNSNKVFYAGTNGDGFIFARQGEWSTPILESTL